MPAFYTLGPACYRPTVQAQRQDTGMILDDCGIDIRENSRKCSDDTGDCAHISVRTKRLIPIAAARYSIVRGSYELPIARFFLAGTRA